MGDACDTSSATIERYLDEELEPAERAQVERHLEACPACRLRLEASNLSADLLRGHLEQAADQADFTGFEQRVMQAVEGQAKPPLTERIGLWFRESLEHHRAAWVASVAGAAAVALVLALVLPWTSPTPQAPGAPVAPGATPGAGARPDAPRTAQVDNEVIIDELEYAGKRSMIFTVSKNDTTVIWMYDFDSAAEDKQGDEI